MKNNEQKTFGISIRTRIVLDETIAYGSGISALLQATKRLHSLHAASKELNMTYRKALQIVDRAEIAFKKKILQKKIGGSKGGGSELTEFGEALVEQFTVFEKELQEFAEERFSEHMRKILE